MQIHVIFPTQHFQSYLFFNLHTHSSSLPPPQLWCHSNNISWSQHYFKIIPKSIFFLSPTASSPTKLAKYCSLIWCTLAFSSAIFWLGPNNSCGVAGVYIKTLSTSLDRMFSDYISYYTFTIVQGAIIISFLTRIVRYMLVFLLSQEDRSCE